MNKIYEVKLKIECNCNNADELRRLLDEFMEIKEYTVLEPFLRSFHGKEYSPIKSHLITLIEYIGEINEKGYRNPCYKKDCNGIIAWDEQSKDFACIKCGASVKERK